MIKRKKLLALLICTAVLFTIILAAGCSSKQANQGTADTINIGAVLDISGPSSSLGIPERDTLQMLTDQLNANGGINGRKIKLIILDNKSDETESVLAAKKLIDTEKLWQSSAPAPAVLPWLW
jgi:branched-chain amino acid transport system substrate-binding protein